MRDAWRTLPLDRLLAPAGALLATLVSLVLQAPGVVLSPDGWAYWQGSVSLLAGDGYRYLDGLPIVAWPPGFSLYLAFWQLVLGNSARTLALAHAAAIGVAAGLWIDVARRIAPARRPTPALVAAALVLALVFPICLRIVLSESLFMAWLGAAIGVAIGRESAVAEAARQPAREVRRTALFALLVAGMLLTRHVGVAFVPALLWLGWRSRPHAPLRDGVKIALAAAAAVAAWLAGRVWLGLLDSNPRMAIDANAPARLVESFVDNAAALASCFAPGSPVAAAFFAILLGVVSTLHGLGGRGSHGATPPAAAAALPAATALAAGVAAVAWAIHGVSGRRIVLPVAAMLVLVLVGWGARARRRAARRLANAALVACAVVQLARAGYWVLYAAGAGREGLPWSSRLVRECVPEPHCALGPSAVTPPPRPWETRPVR